MNAIEIKEVVDKMRAWHSEGHTLRLSSREAALDRLKMTIQKYEKDINAALKADLHKCSTETYMCESGLTLSELSYVRKHLKKWMQPGRVMTPLAQFHATSFTVADPYGVVLIMSPWNYPFMLTMEPLIGAIAAGNCCVVKPSADSKATTEIMTKIISECFPPEWVTVVQGGRAENQALLDQKFDYIFFTGGVTVGKEVMRKAAEHLTPVTLELGGKSPVIVDKTAKLEQSAKRLVFGKFLNCGQTCVAPDYVLIDREVKDEFIHYLKKHIVKQYGKNPLKNKNYVHMINDKHFNRVCGLIDPKKVVHGGESDPETRCIAPTIMDDVTKFDAVMQEEIFGPVLPIIPYDDIDEAIAFVNSRPHPLACYLFTEDAKIKRKVLKTVPFGGGCINDTIMHIVTSYMPFGGVGNSGMGGYHGKDSFETFTHKKSILNKSTWMDMPVRYAPYTKIQDILLKIFLR